MLPGLWKKFYKEGFSFIQISQIQEMKARHILWGIQLLEIAKLQSLYTGISILMQTSLLPTRVNITSETPSLRMLQTIISSSGGSW